MEGHSRGISRLSASCSRRAHFVLKMLLSCAAADFGAAPSGLLLMKNVWGSWEDTQEASERFPDPSSGRLGRRQ